MSLFNRKSPEQNQLEYYQQENLRLTVIAQTYMLEVSRLNRSVESKSRKLKRVKDKLSVCAVLLHKANDIMASLPQKPEAAPGWLFEYQTVKDLFRLPKK